LVQSRRQMHQERVNQFFEAREAMFEQMKERIENWQKNRP